MENQRNGSHSVATSLQIYNFEDDGIIPNSKFSVLYYLDVFPADIKNMDNLMEKRFAVNNWSNSWRNGVFPYHHYHSITHEVLGIYSGSAVLQIGGKKGKEIEVQAGDVLVIPAGVGHKKISADSEFKVIGAYPGGADYDVVKADPSERLAAIENILKVPIPTSDPVLGEKEGLCRLWK